MSVVRTRYRDSRSTTRTMRLRTTDLDEVSRRGTQDAVRTDLAKKFAPASKSVKLEPAPLHRRAEALRNTNGT